MEVSCTQCGLPVRTARATNEPVFCCYGCALVFQMAGDKSDQSQSKWLLSRLGLSLFLAMNVMMLSMILYTPHFFPATDSQFYRQVLGLTKHALLLFSIPVVLLLGLPILLSAIQAGLRGHFGMDALITLGCFGAFALSVHATFTEGHGVYYETATMVLVLITLGRYLEARAKASSTGAIAGLLETSGTARVGDEITVLPGASFPADGVIVTGAGAVNEAMLTGEATPVTKQPGDRVFAGTISFDGSFTIRVTATGTERRIARIARLLDEVRHQKAPIQKFADRLATIFTPVALGVGLLAWWLTGWQAALAVLLIACPCALGIATPLAIWNAIERAARRGVFIRNGAVLEKLAGVRAIFFDKTGTLTTGTPVLQRIETDGDENVALQRVASLEQRSEHPLAKALVAEAQRRGLALGPVTDVQVVPGRGIRGGGLTVGNAGFVGAEGAGVFAAWDGKVQARFRFGESLRSDWPATFQGLQRYRLEMLTGDDQSAAEALGLPFPVRGNLSPEEKVEHVARAAAQMPVAMVGDGINDAPALGRACVGIALGGGTDVAREAADVTFADNELGKLPWLLALARRTRRTIRQNLFWALIYNVALIPVAAAGGLNPIWAALAMVVSSGVVVGNSARLRQWQQ
jgi:heavy metal translocating P-type ATPase